VADSPARKIVCAVSYFRSIARSAITFTAGRGKAAKNGIASSLARGIIGRCAFWFRAATSAAFEK